MESVSIARSAIMAAGFALAACGAQAETLTISKQFSSTFGPYGHKVMELSDAGTKIDADVGAFALTGGSLGDFVAFCLDIDHWLKLPNTYEATEDSAGYVPYASSPLSLERKSLVQKLFDTAYATLDLTKDDQSVGFQLALWEVINESDGRVALGQFDISSGDFKANGYNAGEVFADNLLANIDGPVSKRYKLTFLESGLDQTGAQLSQNLVTATPVPLPASGFLLLGAFGGLAAVGRRMRKQSND